MCRKIGGMMLRRLHRVGKYAIAVAVVFVIAYTSSAILHILSGYPSVVRLPEKERFHKLSKDSDFVKGVDQKIGGNNLIPEITDLLKTVKSGSWDTGNKRALKAPLRLDSYTTENTDPGSKVYLKASTTTLKPLSKTKNDFTTFSKTKQLEGDDPQREMKPDAHTSLSIPAQEDVQKRLLEISRKMNFTLENVPGGPGEFGEGVMWQKENLADRDQREWDDGYKFGGYNVYISDRIALRRQIKDHTPPTCHNISYPLDLPHASVVIPYHKEALSALMRTVLSTLDRAPAYLLKEIILVDDFSESERLLEPLDEFVKYLPKVQVIRNTEREGLMRSRMKGVMAASAPVIVIKDAHTEYMPGWLEPLLLTIHKNRSTIAISNVHVMSKDNFKISKISPTNIHIFDLRLSQVIYRIPDSDLTWRKSETDHVPSPAMLGTEFAINKDFFLEIGGYDPGLEIWGGEEMELSVKAWTCGGSMVVVPCSGVAHLFREAKHRSYILNVKNDMRVAQVWLDEYKHDVYQRFGNSVDNLDIGNITSRLELRKRLQCKSFEWYLKNIAPMIYYPRDLVAQGEIRSFYNDSCIWGSLHQLHLLENQEISAKSCSGQGMEQFWMYTKSGFIRKDSRCLSYENETNSLLQVGCAKKPDDVQCWEITQDNMIVHKPSGKCLTLHEDKTQLTMEHCQEGHEQQQQRQQWHITPRKGAPGV